MRANSKELLRMSKIPGTKAVRKEAGLQTPCPSAFSRRGITSVAAVNFIHPGTIDVNIECIKYTRRDFPWGYPGPLSSHKRQPRPY